MPTALWEERRTGCRVPFPDEMKLCVASLFVVDGKWLGAFESARDLMKAWREEGVASKFA